MMTLAALPLGAITVQGAVFGLLGLVAIVAALIVVLHRNPVVSAMGLVTNFLCVAGFYVLLNAHFFAALQVIVYAGAIVVLITFVIMLLNLQPEARGGPGIVPVVLTSFLGLALAYLLAQAAMGFTPVPEGAEAAPLDASFGSVASIGDVLFTSYFYPFLVVSLALLAAMAGAVILAKRELED